MNMFLLLDYFLIKQIQDLLMGILDNISKDNKKMNETELLKKYFLPLK